MTYTHCKLIFERVYTHIVYFSEIGLHFSPLIQMMLFSLLKLQVVLINPDKVTSLMDESSSVDDTPGRSVADAKHGRGEMNVNRSSQTSLQATHSHTPKEIFR